MSLELNFFCFLFLITVCKKIRAREYHGLESIRHKTESL